MMKASVAKLVSSCLCLLLSSTVGHAQGEQRLVRVRYPQDPWAVTLNLPGFEIGINGTKPDGRRYLFATNKTTGINVSLMLERGEPAATLDGCRKLMERIAQQSGLVDVRISENETSVQVEYTIEIARGPSIQQKFLRVCTPKAARYVDLNLSKVQFRPEDGRQFQRVIQDMRIDENPPLGSFEYWYEGSGIYRAGNLKGSIKPYLQALELEKRDRQLDQTFWRVLVDNLGMAYGITGNVAKAREVFEYGLSQDPTYPLFHYNLACAHAEMKDKKTALKYLRQAFALKHNVIPTERMPDPRTDDSFKRFMRDKEFREEMDSLAGYLDTITLQVPNRPWRFAIDLPGFRVYQQSETKPGGSMIQARHEKDGIHATIFLNPIQFRGETRECDKGWDELLTSDSNSVHDVKRSETESQKRLEYSHTTVTPGMSYRSMRMARSCLVHEGYYASVDLWKPQAHEADKEKMSKILDSARFEPLPQSTANPQP